MSDPDSESVTQILADLRAGRTGAADRLLRLVYAELRSIAGHLLRQQPPGQTLQPTALVHEAFLRLVGQKNIAFNDRAHFLAICATSMRGILADHARRRATAKRGGDWKRVTLSLIETPQAADGIDLIDLDEILCRLSALHQRQARIVECRFFSGMSEAEVAEALGVSRSTVAGEWRMARAWLSAELQHCRT